MWVFDYSPPVAKLTDGRAADEFCWMDGTAAVTYSKETPTTALAASVSRVRGRRNQMRPGGAFVTKDNTESHFMRMSARIMPELMTY